MAASSSEPENQENKAKATGQNSTVKQKNEFRKGYCNFNFEGPPKMALNFNFPRVGFFTVGLLVGLAATSFSMGYLRRAYEEELKVKLSEAAGLDKPKDKTDG